jgi:hypothetical protein
MLTFIYHVLGGKRRIGGGNVQCEPGEASVSLLEIKSSLLNWHGSVELGKPEKRICVPRQERSGFRA